MSDPVTYTFYGTTVPVLRSITSSAISILTTAKDESSKAAEGTFPSEQDLLNAQLRDMPPLRMQPILLAKFSIGALARLQLNGSAPIPAPNPSFSSFDDIIEFFKKFQAVLDAIDEKEYNDSAEKGFDVEVANKTLHMTGLADSSSMALLSQTATSTSMPCTCF